MTDPALSFGSAAADYDRHRPPYPAAAVDWVTGRTAPGRVVDLGAGTGILTRGLSARGHDVVPVEPDAGMRAQLAAATPGTTALAGCAEAIPLPDTSVDAVVAGQAYHWFDPERAHPEVARVLRAGGTFGVLWNIRDESVPWMAALGEIAGVGDGREPGPELSSADGPFVDQERAEFRHEVTHTAGSLLALLTTRSYYLVADGRDRRRMTDAVRELTRDHPDLAGRESFALPYRTICHRARRR